MAFPWMAAAMFGGSALSFFGGRGEQKRMRREMRAWRQLQQQQLDFAKDQWRHYQDTYGDVEKLMVADAVHGVTGDYDGVTSRAAADVEAQFDNAIDRNQRDMMRYGLDPSSGRYQSSDRQMGLQRAATSALAQNTARNSERNFVRDSNWQRRFSVGQFGAGLIRDAGQGVQQAMQNMGQMHAQNANTYGSLASNLFAQAGEMGMYGLMSGADWMANRSAPETPARGFSGFNQPDGLWSSGVDPTFSIASDSAMFGATPQAHSSTTRFGTGRTGLFPTYNQY